MTAERWQHIKSLFNECLELPLDRREPFLDELSLADDVRREIVKLLHNFDSAGESFLDSPEVLRVSIPQPNLVSLGAILADRFRVLRFLGRGGMGEVYEAHDREINVAVALKILIPTQELSDTASARFRRELQLARRVTHPNVCRLFDLNRHEFASGSMDFLTMELLEGRTLAALLKEHGSFTPEESAPIAVQMLQGLQAAHDAGIVHRDLKPGNIMVVPRPSGPPRVVLTDFGLARADTEQAGNSSLTKSQEVMGTVSYMAPEQFAGFQVSPRTDLYAFGVIWFEMLTNNL